MEEAIAFQPCRFLSLHAKTAASRISWEALVDELKGTTHERATTLYRTTTRQLQLLEPNGNPDEIQRLKEHRSRIKQDQPAFIPSVSLEGGRTLTHVTGYSGFIMVDIDNLPDDRFENACQQVYTDPYTFLAYITLSGKGIRVIVRVAEKLGKSRFAAAWQAINNYYAKLIGTRIDSQCKNATRMSVICHDPQALYRPEATPFPLPAAERKAKPARITAQRAEPTVRRLVEKEGIAYVAHSHNDYICRCLYWMNRFGIAHDEAERWALEAFADYDANAVRSTARSCYALTDEHGSKRLRDYEQATNRPQRRATVREMERFINERLEIRRNLLTSHIEIRLKEENDWRRLNDTIENSLWRAMQNEGIDADLFRMRTLLTSDFAPDFHPLTHYLDQLPPWDGTTDHIGRLAAMVHTVDNQPERFADCLKRWLVGMLAGALDERVVNQVILVLIGRQGSYKTSFMQNLLPPCLRDYYTTKTNSQRLTKDDLFTVTENLLVNYEEIDAMRPNELNQLKALTTTLHINERPPYARNKVNLPHVASFCATGNNPLFLSDDTGNRRWLVFEVSGIDSPWDNPIHYEGIYAQAKALLDNGYRYWFHEREIDEINQRNRRFETPNPARELILTYYRKPGPDERIRPVTASQIVARFGGSIRLSPGQVGRALRELGFDSQHTRNGNFWFMIERSLDEIQSLLPEKPLDPHPNAGE